jgi:CO/xanthine dehydrogenase Mo-binding subunit
MPPLRTVLLETEIGPGPFGAKAAGEVTNSGVAPAVANAVAAAVGARVTELPITAERVLDALGRGSAASPGDQPLGGQKDRSPGRMRPA